MNYRRTVLLLAAIPLLAMPAVARADDDPATEFRAEMRGRNEAPLTLSGGRGRLRLTVNDDETSVHFVLQFTGLQTAVGASHIHVGQPNVNGSSASPHSNSRPTTWRSCSRRFAPERRMPTFTR